MDEKITLRDQFAMAALQGLLAFSGDASAKEAYLFADMMLEARKKDVQP